MRRRHSQRLALAASLLLATAIAPATAAAEESSNEAIAPEPPSEPARRWELEAGFVYSFGERHGFGGQVNASHSWRVWRTRHGSGLMDVGLLVGYEAEPYALSNRWLGQAVASGATHRIEALLVVGHSIRMLSSRRLLLSVQLYGGWVYVALRGHIEDELYGISRDSEAGAGSFSTGMALALGYSPTDRLTIIAKVRAPFPYAPATVTAYALASLDLSIRLP